MGDVLQWRLRSKLRRVFPAALLILVASLPAHGQRLQNSFDKTKSLAPYVTSPQAVVEKMLEVSRLKPGDTLYDLGSGDGRILITAAQKYNVKAVGVEISPELARKATDRISQLGLQQRAKVIVGNLMDVDISPADVVVIYLLTQSNDLLRPKLEKALKPGARVVSHDFQVRGWKPVAVEKTTMNRRTHSIYVYELPKSIEAK